MKLLGIIGYPLGHSFSKPYFNKKFADLDIAKDWFYETFPLQNIEQLHLVLREHQNLVGLNVTIPYKQTVIPFLDELDESAANVGAVNCIKIQDGKLKGYNTDTYGFEKSLLGLFNSMPPPHLKALILGTGGAAKAVAYVLRKSGIDYHYVSRMPSDTTLCYEDIDEHIIKTHRLIVNTTPLGMSPYTEGCPDLPYKYMDNHCFLYDLIYNPELTEFMKRGIAQGAKAKSGLDMLYFQAEKGWEIWN